MTAKLAISLMMVISWPVFAESVLQAQQAPVNPAIDMQGFLRVSQRAALHRETRRVAEDEFARMSREPGTIVLDARSKDKYDELHVRRAINLSFPDIAIESLKKIIPDKKTRILIYCNNNFRNAEGPFPSKLPSASQYLDVYCAVQLWLSQRVRVAGHAGIECIQPRVRKVGNAIEIGRYI